MWTNRSHLPGGTDASRNNVSKQFRRLPVPKQPNTINTLYCFAYHLDSSSQQLTIYRLSSKENIVQAKAIKHDGHVDEFMPPPPSRPWLDSPIVGEGLLLVEVSIAHPVRHTTPRSTPLDKRSARHTDLCLTTQNSKETDNHSNPQSQ
jgi:hypothetical protein